MIQDNVKLRSEYNRATLTELFVSLGGFISMITRLTNMALKGYQGYAINKSLIKKVYSVRNPRSKSEKDERETKFKQSFANADTGQVRLMDAIQDRAVFSYAYRKSCCLRIRDNITWWFTCWCEPCCPCKSRKAKRDERLFKRGLRKLFTEIDLLELIKQLRVLRFMSSLYLG